MKKQLTAAVLLLALLLTMAGCSTASAVRKLDAAEDALEAKLDAAGDRLEDKIRSTVSPTLAPAAPEETLPVPSVPGAPEPSRMLTEEQARRIALDYLGLSAGQTDRIRTEYEVDDGVPQFDIELQQGEWEHEFEIHAENGQILSYDKDHKHD